VKVESSEIVKFASKDHTFKLHTGSGTFHAEIGSDMLEELASRGWIRGYIKGNRLIWVQMTVPPYVADRVLFPDRAGRRKSAKEVFHSDANDTYFLERSTTTRSQNYQHHAERCSSWRPDRPVVKRNL